jgi:dolichyl-phosphate beta-glucosyltransferase
MTNAAEAAPLLSLVIPAYDEAARLPATLASVRAFCAAHRGPLEVVFVDDGSHDATPHLLEAARAQMPPGAALRVLRHPANRGKGAAVRTGCLAARGRYVVYADADLAVPLDEVDRIVAALKDGCDVAIGTRVHPGGQDMRASQPFTRRLAGWLFTAVRRWLAVPDIADTQCPMKGFRAEAARALFSRQRLTGWTFDAELLFLARRAGMRICQIPVQWRHVEGSKLRPGPRLALRILGDLLWMRLAHLSGVPLPGTRAARVP